MPTYEYECLSCQTRFERSQRFSDPPVAECPECGGAVRRVLYPAGIVFKGSGWYITDSRKSTAGDSGSGGSEASAKPDAKAESKAEPGGKGEAGGKAEAASPAKAEGGAASTSAARRD